MVEEKSKSLRRLFRRIRSHDRELRFTVEAVHGSSQSKERFPFKDVVVCTIEKANSILSSLLTSARHRDNVPDVLRLCVVVLDEIHMISDPHRGYALELLVSLIKRMDSFKRTKEPATPNTHPHVPLSGSDLTTTMPTPTDPAASQSSQLLLEATPLQ